MRPVLQALVLADHIYQDKHSGKLVIAGTFTQLWAGEFPKRFNRETFAYVCLTGFDRSIKLVIRFVDLSTNEVLMEMAEPILVKSNDRLASHQVVAQVPPFPMPHPGVFAFEVVCDGEMLGSIRLTVKERKG